MFELLITGLLIGFLLGLTGGGGSIMAVPLLSFYVGLTPPHVAFGTAAVAVSASALLNLLLYAQGGLVQWQKGLNFALFGMAGAYVGSTMGQMVNGKTLLAGFGGVMILVGLLSLRKTADAAQEKPHALPRLALGGLIVGAFSGFFGIGGGFLIVPMLVFASGMGFNQAIATSLLAVFLFGLTTATNYALNGLVDWRVAGFVVLFGLLGGVIGKAINARLGQSLALIKVFSVVCISAGIYVMVKA